MLDDFSAVGISKKPETQPGPGRPQPPAHVEGTGADGDLTDDDFAKQFEASMAEMLGQMGTSVSINRLDQPRVSTNQFFILLA